MAPTATSTPTTKARALAGVQALLGLVHLLPDPPVFQDDSGTPHGAYSVDVSTNAHAEPDIDVELRVLFLGEAAEQPGADFAAECDLQLDDVAYALNAGRFTVWRGTWAGFPLYVSASRPVQS